MNLDMNSFAIGMAGLHGSLHSLRILANRGLVSPLELDQCLEGIMETLENLPPDMLAIVQPRIDPVLVEMKQAAANNWQAE